jgi:hypothetical protein
MIFPWSGTMSGEMPLLPTIALACATFLAACLPLLADLRPPDEPP